jgi:hypothetical protein
MYFEMYGISTSHSLQYCGLLAEVQVQGVHFKRSDVAYFRVLNAFERQTLNLSDFISHNSPKLLQLQSPPPTQFDTYAPHPRHPQRAQTAHTSTSRATAYALASIHLHRLIDNAFGTMIMLCATAYFPALLPLDVHRVRRHEPHPSCACLLSKSPRNLPRGCLRGDLLRIRASSYAPSVACNGRCGRVRGDLKGAPGPEDDVLPWDAHVFVHVFCVAFGGLVVAHDGQVADLL